MQILAIDYGKKKAGLAISAGFLAEPYRVLHFKNEEEFLAKVQAVVKEENIGKVVVGVSEGKMAERSKNFAKRLAKECGLEVDTFDETLSTKEAQKKAIESGMRRVKRKKMEDAFAAALILQRYLEREK